MLPRDNWEYEGGRRSDGLAFQLERKQSQGKIPLLGQRRKQSMRQPYSTTRHIQQMSEKKIPSVYNNSVSLQTLEHSSQFQQKNLVLYLKERVSHLEKEISVLHMNYAARIDELTSRNNEKCEIYLNLIDQMQNRHLMEKENYCKIIADFQQERSQINSIQKKMNFINSGIEDILKQSAQRNNKNKQLLKLIEEKDKLINKRDQAIKERDLIIKENEGLLDSIEIELKTCRKKIKEYQQSLQFHEVMKSQCMQLKDQIIGMIDQVKEEVATETTQSSLSVCTITQLKVDQCNHCKINRMEAKLKLDLPEMQ